MATKSLVINLYGGPGSGKSTTAAGVFFHLKSLGQTVELVREYAKDVVWEGRTHLFDDQFYIFAKQRKRMRDLNGKVDFIVTDSPLLLSCVYGAGESEHFQALVREEYARYDNLNIWILRTKPYSESGRIQTRQEAEILDARIREVIDPGISIPGDEDAPDKIVDLLRMLGFAL